MSQVRVRQKHQITLPANIVQDAHIIPNDTLEVAFVNGVITLTPKKRHAPKNAVMAFAGVAKGVWGETPEAVEATLTSQRESRGR